MTFDDLQEASRERSLMWNPHHIDIPVEFSILELLGEAGELANAQKKLLRGKYGLVGAINDNTNLLEELGDVVICAGLVANKLGVSLSDVVRMKFNKTSDKHGFTVKL